MYTNKIIRLVDQLYEKTVRGQIKWEPTSRENAFQVAFPDSAVRILYENTNTCTVEIYNEEGVLIENIRPSLNDDYPTGFEEKIGELFEMARGQAFNVEQKIDNILNTLSSGFHS